MLLSLSFWPAGPSFCLPHLRVVCGWQGCGNRPGLCCPRAFARGGGRGPLTWRASLAVALSWALWLRSLASARACAVPLEWSRLCLRCLKPSGGVAPVPPAPSPGCRCCGCLWLLPVPLGSLGGGRGGKRRRHVCASPRLEGGCRCRAVVPTCVWGIGLVGACLRACHPAPVGWCVPGVSSSRGVVRSGRTSAGAGRAVANGIGNAPSLPLPWPRMLEVPFLPYTADPLARLIGLSGGAPSACLLPARRGGAVGVGCGPPSVRNAFSSDPREGRAF